MMKRKFFLLIFLLFLLPVLSACHHSKSPHISQVISKQNFTFLKIDSVDSDIELRPSTKTEVVYKGPKNAKPDVSLNGETLSINQKEISKSTKFKWIPFGFSITSGSSTIIIYLPKQQLTNLKIASDDGDINGSGIINAQRVHLNSDDGDINLKILKVQSGSIASSDGDISITHLTSQNGFKLSADDGDIDIDHCNANGYNASTDDGDLTINGNKYDSDDANDGESYQHKLNSNNVLVAHSDDGDIDIN